MTMKIYTKTGDKGTTSLVGGSRVSKDHPRVEAYGTIDELIAWIGYVRDQVQGEEDAGLLLDIQRQLMTCASHIACDDESFRTKLPELSLKIVTVLEQAIDRMEKDLTPLSSFVLPGGLPVASCCHIARNVCRRAERQLIRMRVETRNEELVLMYLNRLSDFLFVFSRYLLTKNGRDENLWKP